MTEVTPTRALCVDLDGTLLRTDLLYESFLRMLGSKPWLVFLLPFWLMRGKAHMKRRLAAFGVGDIRLLPYDQRVLDLLRQTSARPRVLCTASDLTLVKPIAEHLKLFEQIYCSDGHINLAGRRKADLLVERFGERGFDYVANDEVDLRIWQHAHAAWIVNSGGGVVRAASKICQVVAHWPREGAGPKTWLKALRLHQWLKNLLVFVPLLASHQFTNLDAVTAALLGFLAFGLCASGVYLLNDLLDLESDRDHPRKRARPFAAGTLDLRAGLLVTPLLTISGFVIAWIASPAFAAVLGGYYLITLAYSLKLKQVVIIDVVVLAALYTIRIVGGGAAIGVDLSFWLLSLSLFMFMSLAMLKRYTELQLTIRQGKSMPSGRGYHVEDLAVVQSLGAASGVVAVLVLCLYINTSESQALYRHPTFLWLLCPVLLYWISRTWLIAHRGEMHDDPVVFAVKDRGSLLTVMAGAAAVVAAI
jgi:4-hydroxybenzoate polyprenyltransferase